MPLPLGGGRYISSDSEAISFLDLQDGLVGGGRSMQKFKRSFTKSGGRQKIGLVMREAGAAIGSSPDPRVASVGHAIGVGGAVLMGTGSKSKAKKGIGSILKNRDAIMGIGSMLADEAGYGESAARIDRARRINAVISGGGANLAGRGVRLAGSGAGKKAKKGIGSIWKNRDTALAIGQLIASETGNSEAADRLGRLGRLNDKLSGRGRRPRNKLEIAMGY